MNILAQFSDWNHRPERRAQNTYGGLGYYRIVKPAEQVKSHKVDVVGTEIKWKFGTDLETQWKTIWDKYDAFWCLHFVDPASASAVIVSSAQRKKKFILDIDDNFLDLPESNKEYARFGPGKKDRAHLATILSFADAITVSTEPLKEKIFNHIKEIHGIEKDIYLVPNMNDIRDWDVELAPKHKDRFVIGYTGSTSHMDDLRLILPSIKKLMLEHKHVWFEILGILTPEEAKAEFVSFPQELRNRIALVPVVPTFREYPQWLGQQRWNVGIAPLVDTAFTRSKSHIKWLEYSSVKIPTVASRVYPYFMELNGRETMVDGENGWLCRPDEWYSRLSYLVEHPKLCEEMGEKAYQYIKKHWQYDQEYFDKVFNEIMTRPKQKPSFEI